MKPISAFATYQIMEGDLFQGQGRDTFLIPLGNRSLPCVVIQSAGPAREQWEIVKIFGEKITEPEINTAIAFFFLPEEHPAVLDMSNDENALECNRCVHIMRSSLNHLELTLSLRNYEHVPMIETRVLPGKLIRQAREEAELSIADLADLADAVDVTPYKLERIENDEQEVDLLTIMRIAKVCGISVDQLLYRETQPYAEPIGFVSQLADRAKLLCRQLRASAPDRGPLFSCDTGSRSSQFSSF